MAVLIVGLCDQRGGARTCEQSGAAPVARGRRVWEAARIKGRLEVGRDGETSGLASSRLRPGVVYGHDDSGGDPVVRGFGPRGRLRIRLRLRGALNLDWEDIAWGPGPGGRSCLYVGDIGDNFRFRRAVTIYRIAEPARAGSSNSGMESLELEAATLRARYTDGPHDAEALLSDPRDGSLFVITKDRGHPGVYRFVASGTASAPGRIEGRLEPLGRLRITGEEDTAVVTAAAFSPAGDALVVLTEKQVVEYVLEAPLRDIAQLRDPRARVHQWPGAEAITYRADGLTLLVTCEGRRPPLIEIPSTQALLYELLAHR